MTFAPPDLLRARVARLRRALEAASLDALVVSHLPNIFYFSNFSASAGVLVVGASRLYLLADFRYSAAIDALAADGWLPDEIEVGRVDGSYDQALVRALETGGWGPRVGFEGARVSVKQHGWLAARLATSGQPEGDGAAQADGSATAVALVSTDGLVEALRRRKDEYELDVLREAGRRLSAVARDVLHDVVVAGRSEQAIAADIDWRVRAAGFERPAFETIVASGPNAALPHAHAGERVTEACDLVVVDFGGVYRGYCVDLTRTVALGAPTERMIDLYRAVASAQDAALGRVRAGVPAHVVDAAARDRLAELGLGEAFGHGTGHGLGLEVHEEPRIGKRRPDDPPTELDAGMVCTIEPGAYLPGFGGVRLEDDVIVTPDGCEMITDVPRDAQLLSLT